MRGGVGDRLELIPSGFTPSAGHSPGTFPIKGKEALCELIPTPANPA